MKMIDSRIFVLGDIHGAYKALCQVLNFVVFDYNNDTLICLGDVCDGWSQTKECIDKLLKINNLIYIIGNHDKWVLEWMTSPQRTEWVTQGGQGTINSYISQSHIEFLKTAHLWFEKKNRLFVHAGIDPNKDLKKQNLDTCIWDRDLIQHARKKHNQNPNYKYGGFEEIYIGHSTSLWLSKDTKPLHYCNIWNLDTGAGWNGKLTIMDIDTKQYWQSDFVKNLYPKEKRRT